MHRKAIVVNKLSETLATSRAALSISQVGFGKWTEIDSNLQIFIHIFQMVE